ncbi:hypothetical protein GF345_00890 [Candidatus Woesearchaeota archaeon]|nr:hypothetical protein [Candidatus Woesearchaeota archaeon]
MIFRRLGLINIRDIIWIMALALLWTVASSITNRLFGFQSAYIFSILTLSFFLTFAVNISPKQGTGLLFLILGGLFTYTLNDIGSAGINRLILLLATGVVFEIIFFLLSIEYKKNIRMNTIIAATISAGLIPVIMGLLYSLEIVSRMIVPVINLMLLSLVTAFAGSLISFLFWYRIKATKLYIRMVYMNE